MLKKAKTLCEKLTVDDYWDGIKFDIVRDCKSYVLENENMTERTMINLFNKMIEKSLDIPLLEEDKEK